MRVQEQMNTQENIPADWRAWISSNQARGCSKESMLDSMLKAGLNAAVASAWLASMAGKDAGAPVATVPADMPYRYEASRIAAGNALVVAGVTVRIALRLAEPDIVVIDDLLSAAECEELIAQSQQKLKPSTIIDPDTGAARPIDARSSEGAFFQRAETALVQRLEQRISALMNWPAEYGEGLQVLHYRSGGEYKPHFDYFPLEKTGSAIHLAKGGQRVSTLILYLNEVEQGGETTFPQVGLSVTPRRGTAVYFSYCNSLGQIDPATLHGGAPVLAGEKWIATKWMRQQRYG
jgi:prolyl 4-hydroxylase